MKNHVAKYQIKSIAGRRGIWLSFHHVTRLVIQDVYLCWCCIER